MSGATFAALYQFKADALWGRACRWFEMFLFVRRICKPARWNLITYMELDGILQGNQALLYMERYVDEGTRTYSPFAARSEASPEYQPRSVRPSFELITVFAPQSQVSIYQSDPQNKLPEVYVPSEPVLFLDPPETLASLGIDNLDELHVLRRGEPLQVAPTASTRTVLTTETPANVPHHFIKLHYPRSISRFNRRLRRKNIRTSVTDTIDMAHIRICKF